jgi:hypothetical protein
MIVHSTYVTPEILNDAHTHRSNNQNEIINDYKLLGCFLQHKNILAFGLNVHRSIVAASIACSLHESAENGLQVVGYGVTG